jgi:hypothetical protein
MRRINLLLWRSIQHLDISTMFYLSTTSISIHMPIPYILANLNLTTPQNHLLLHTWVFSTTQLYDKQGYFNFVIVLFPFLCSNIPISPAYGVYISQLIRYARASSTYDQFLNRGSMLTKKLMSQGFLLFRLQAASSMVVTTI